MEQVLVASLKANATKKPCAAWLQWSAGQTPAAVAAAGPPPCPCLVTPAPLMSPQEAQVTQVTAAADKAMLEGQTRIQEAAEGAFDAAEKNQTDNLQTMLSSEKTRQTKEMA